MMRSIQQIDIRSIAPRENPIRPVDDDYALAIAVSIGEAGQLQPILVRPRAVSDGPAYELVCGGHRLRAAELAGLSFIDAEVRELNDAEARIAEIDENAVRKELSALDFALSMAERKKLYEQAYPEAAHGKKKDKSNQYERKVAKLATFHSFAKDAAKKTGFSDRTIRASVELSRALTPEIVAHLRGTKLADNAAALKKLSQLPIERRREAAEALGSGAAKSLSAALDQIGWSKAQVTDPATQLTAKFTDLLSRTSAGQRREWLLMILQNASSGELPALAKALAGKLSAKGQKLVLEALAGAATAGDEEAA
jgi:ParB family chromosome partitioning protein